MPTRCDRIAGRHAEHRGRAPRQARAAPASCRSSSTSGSVRAEQGDRLPRLDHDVDPTHGAHGFPFAGERLRETLQIHACSHRQLRSTRLCNHHSPPPRLINFLHLHIVRAQPSRCDRGPSTQFTVTVTHPHAARAFVQSPFPCTDRASALDLRGHSGTLAQPSGSLSEASAPAEQSTPVSTGASLVKS